MSGVLPASNQGTPLVPTAPSKIHTGFRRNFQAIKNKIQASTSNSMLGGKRPSVPYAFKEFQGTKEGFGLNSAVDVFTTPMLLQEKDAGNPCNDKEPGTCLSGNFSVMDFLESSDTSVLEAVRAGSSTDVNQSDVLANNDSIAILDSVGSPDPCTKKASLQNSASGSEVSEEAIGAQRPRFASRILRMLEANGKFDEILLDLDNPDDDPLDDVSEGEGQGTVTNEPNMRRVSAQAMKRAAAEDVDGNLQPSRCSSRGGRAQVGCDFLSARDSTALGSQGRSKDAGADNHLLQTLKSVPREPEAFVFAGSVAQSLRRKRLEFPA